MSHYGIPIDRSCASYRPGHQVHWIYAKKASEKDQPLVAVSITFRGYGWVDIQGRDLSWTLWTHEATRLHQVWDTCGCAVWKTRWHMLSLPGPYGSCFNMATWDERTPCLEKVGPPADLHTTVDRVLWEARTYGGYTVAMSSMTPGEAAKVVKDLVTMTRGSDTGQQGTTTNASLRSRPSSRRRTPPGTGPTGRRCGSPTVMQLAGRAAGSRCHDRCIRTNR